MRFASLIDRRDNRFVKHHKNLMKRCKNLKEVEHWNSVHFRALLDGIIFALHGTQAITGEPTYAKHFPTNESNGC